MILRLQIYVCFADCSAASFNVTVKKNRVCKGCLYETYPYKRVRRWPCFVKSTMYIYNFLPYNCHIILYFPEIKWSIRLNWLDSRKGRDAFTGNDKGDNDPIKLTRTKRKREQEQKEEEMVEEKEKNANNVAVYLRVLG